MTESLGQEDNVYNLAFDISKRTLSIQLLEPEDETFELNDLADYTNYVSNYIDWEHDTPGVDRKAMHTPFLKRNISSHEEETLNLSGMQYKICRNTYHMFYVVGKEDVFYRSTRQPEEKRANNASWLDKKKLHTVEQEEKAYALLRNETT